jgi:hypothetical protein
MFNRKKNLKPYYKDYAKIDDGFKKYIVDSIKYERKLDNKDAINFDLDAFSAAVPDGIEPGNVYRANEKISPEARAALKDVMDKFGFQIFSDMMADMGMSEEVIAHLINREKTPQTPPTGKTIPGFNDSSPDVDMERINDMLYTKTLEVMGSMIDDALKVNDPQMLIPIVNKMDEIINEKGDADSTARTLMQELADTTRVFVELIDDNVTTVEEYESFQNKLINYFIQDEVEDVNNSAHEEHKDHEPSECEYIQRTDGQPPLQVLYRRIHAMDGTDGNKVAAIPGLSVVVFDTVRGHIVPIAFSLHEAMTEKTGESFIAACKSEGGTEFLMETLINYRKHDEERFDKIVNARSIEMPDGNGATAAGVVVKPEVITPKASVMRELLCEVRETFNVDAAEAFAGINPEDFLK